MSYLTWQTTASANVTIDGINIAENCPPQNINNAIRSVMAGVAELRDALPDVSGFAPLASPQFTGQPDVSGRGAMRHNNDPALASAQEYFLTDGSAFPSSPQAGDVVNFYS